MTDTILIVDDSQSMLTSVRHALEKGGFAVIEATDGEVALDLIKKHKDELSMIVCDLNIPKVDGIQVLERIERGKDGKPILPFLMLTTEVDKKMMLKARDLDVKGWMVKPFKPNMLLMAVQKIVAANKNRVA